MMFRWPMAAMAKAAVQVSPKSRVVIVAKTSEIDRSPRIRRTATAQSEIRPAVAPPISTLSNSSWSSAAGPVRRSLRPWASPISRAVASRRSSAIGCSAGFSELWSRVGRAVTKLRGETSEGSAARRLRQDSAPGLPSSVASLSAAIAFRTWGRGAVSSSAAAPVTAWDRTVNRPRRLMSWLRAPSSGSAPARRSARSVRASRSRNRKAFSRKKASPPGRRSSVKRSGRSARAEARRSAAASAASALGPSMTTTIRSSNCGKAAAKASSLRRNSTSLEIMSRVSVLIVKVRAV